MKRYDPLHPLHQGYSMYSDYDQVTCHRDIPMSVPEQRQTRQPGLEGLIVPGPMIENPDCKGS